MRPQTIANVALYVIALALIAGATWSLLCDTSCEPPAPYDEPAVVAPADDDLCGRYHQRKRTNRFFRRVG